MPPVILPSAVKSTYCHDKQVRLIRDIDARINAMDVQQSINRHYKRENTGYFIWRRQRAELELLRKRALNPIQLDINHIIEPDRNYQVINKKFRKLGTLKEHSTAVFQHYNARNSHNADAIMRIIIRHLHEQTTLSRITQLKKRLLYAIAEASRAGHFVIFNTLTANETAYATGVFTERKAVKAYLRAIKQDIPGAQHFGVIEAGEKTGRLHYHFIHILPTLPPGSHDPNAGRINPNYRELNSFKQYWNHGFSKPIMVRFNRGDAFAKLNYRWPSEPTSKEVIPLYGTDPLVLANYVGKYIFKSQYIPKGESPWRTNLSRQLGLTQLSNLLLPLNDWQLMEIINLPTMPNKFKLLNRKIPLTLLKSLASKLWLKRNLNWKSKKRKMILNAISELTAAPSLLKRLRDSTPWKPPNNYLNIAFIQTQNLMSTGTSNIMMSGIKSLNLSWSIEQ